MYGFNRCAEDLNSIIENSIERLIAERIPYVSKPQQKVEPPQQLDTAAFYAAIHDNKGDTEVVAAIEYHHNKVIDLYGSISEGFCQGTKALVDNTADKLRSCLQLTEKQAIVAAQVVNVAMFIQTDRVINYSDKLNVSGITDSDNYPSLLIDAALDAYHETADRLLDMWDNVNT